MCNREKILHTASCHFVHVQYVKCTLALLQVFVSSGLGGMSGAQPKAATIVGCIAVIAEVNAAALLKRHQQG